MQHLVESVAADRKARVVRFGDAPQVVLQRQRGVEIHDVGARHHQRFDQAVVEAEHIAHHRAFLLFDHADFRTFLQQAVDFLLD